MPGVHSKVSRKLANVRLQLKSGKTRGRLSRDLQEDEIEALRACEQELTAEMMTAVKERRAATVGRRTHRAARDGERRGRPLRTVRTSSGAQGGRPDEGGDGGTNAGADLLKRQRAQHDGKTGNVQARIIALQRAFYDWDQEHGMAAQKSRARGSREAVFEGGDASLSSSDWVQKLILQEERVRDAVSTAKVREWLKNKLGGRCVTNVATAILTAVEALCELGIVEKCNEDAHEARRQSSGHLAFDFRKRSWHTIQASEQARAHVARLRVSADLFSD